MKARNTKSFFLIGFILVLTGCTITTSRAKAPIINNMNQLKKELANVVFAKNINLAGKEITINNKTTSELEVRITNGQNVPKTDAKRETFARLIAKLVKMSLRDFSQFDFYKIVFVDEVEDGSMTKRNWVGYRFNTQEITAADINIGKAMTSVNGDVYGGSIFTNKDSQVICVVRNFTFFDTSAVTIRLFKRLKKSEEPMGERHVKVNPYDNYLCHRINVGEFYDVWGSGKYKFEVLSHDTIIASKEFELK